MLSVTRSLSSTTFFLLFSNAAPAPGIIDEIVDRDAYSSILATLSAATATSSTPTSPSQASIVLSSVLNATPNPTDIFALAGNLVEAGLTRDSVTDALNFVDGLLVGSTVITT